jgi:inosine-uridine nucleoside N-ribohydrolase
MTPAQSPTTPDRPNIVFDTDPGADDALALIWLCALHHAGKINLAQVTAVGGNVDVDDTWLNADLLLQLCDCLDVALSAGDSAGGEQARHVHGHDGLAGLRGRIDLTPRRRASRTATDVLTALHALEPAPALIAVGPLTNLAHAVHANSAALDHAERCVVMGGALGEGNITPYAEFNVHHDPQSFATALDAASVDLVTLETTQKVYFDADIAQLRLPGALGAFVHDLLGAMCRSSQERLGKPRFFVHDAVAVAAVCYPSLLRFEATRLGVVLDGHERGALRSDVVNAAPARVATSVDAEALKNQLIVDISDLCERLAAAQ